MYLCRVYSFQFDKIQLCSLKLCFFPISMQFFTFICLFINLCIQTVQNNIFVVHNGNSLKNWSNFTHSPCPPMPLFRRCVAGRCGCAVIPVFRMLIFVEAEASITQPFRPIILLNVTTVGSHSLCIRLQAFG